MNSLSIAVLGAGSWGGTMAQYLSQLGYNITVWHKNPDELSILDLERCHPFVPDLRFDDSIRFTGDLRNICDSNILVIAVPSHGVRDLVTKLPMECGEKTVVNLAKGIENDTLLRVSEVIVQAGHFDAKSVVSLYGPSHAEEVAKKVPTTVVVAGTDRQTIEFIQSAFSSVYFRVYTNQDIVGVELGGSIKNVIAIAAGVCDAIGFGDNTKSALITRGIAEITRLGVAMGARKETFSGLSGIGDLIVTCLSRHSRNRYVGEEIGKSRKLNEIVGEMHMVAEGIRTAKSVRALMKKYNVDMPICAAVYGVLFEGADPREAVRTLMTRQLVYENYT